MLSTSVEVGPVTDPELGRTERWWNRLTELDRQRVEEFRVYHRLPADLVLSYVETVGGGVASLSGAEARVLEMPEGLVRFLENVGDRDP